jgi:hypothetical protein
MYDIFFIIVPQREPPNHENVNFTRRLAGYDNIHVQVSARNE